MSKSQIEIKARKIPNKRILIVEDEPAIREVCQRVLAGEGYEVSVAENGKAAQVMIAKREYDLSLIDIRTPIIDGQELYIWLLQEYPRMASKVIFTTGDVIGGDTSRFVEHTMRPFLCKPFEIEELKALVKKALYHNS